MNNIILLILLSILLYFVCKYNIYLGLILLIIMFIYYCKLNHNVEGNDEFYKYNFAELLNKNVKTSRKYDNLFYEIMNKLNRFLNNYLDIQDPPVNQPCIGDFNSWSPCSKDCGQGEQYRKFIVVQKEGKDGIKCIFEDGELDKKTCFTMKCNRGDDCEFGIDCDTNFCDPQTNKCGIQNECTKNALHNCDYERCNALGENYHYNIENGCQRYNLIRVFN